MKKEKVLLAGATGYLGRYISHQLLASGYSTRLIVRNKQKAKFDSNAFDIVEAQVTQAASLYEAFNNIDVVISSVGITRQKDGLTYMDVDYQANINLLNEAKKAGVRKFIYISVLEGAKFQHLKIIKAKELFVMALKASGLEYTIIRPNGFFSDMGDFLDMAKKGKVYLFGKGKFSLNPIHGEDLAELCVNAIELNDKEINVGGPDVLTQNELAGLALKACSKKPKIVHLPDWIRKAVIWVFRTFTSSKTYGPIEFFLTVMAGNMIAPKYGKHRLEDFFNNQIKE